MIIKGQARGRASELAEHLLRADQNERIELIESRGTIARAAQAALKEMEARAAGIRCKRPLYHAAISPEAQLPLTLRQRMEAVDLLESKLGLGGQPRLVMLHRKAGREHLHVVWSRVDVERGRAISDSWNFRRHEEAARDLENAFGHRAITGAHLRPRGRGRPLRTPRTYEFRQSERSGIRHTEITKQLTALWKLSRNGREFEASASHAGYRLARGDRRAFVVIDGAGEVHSLARRIDGASTRELAVRFADIDPQRLPSVASARAQMRYASGTSKITASLRAAKSEVTHALH